MAVDPQTLLSEVACYSCMASDAGMMSLLKLGLLRQIVLAQNPMADVTAQGLLTQAQCFSCFGAGAGEMKLMELALLAQIATNGSAGGGGGSNPPSGIVSPNGNVIGAPGATYFNKTDSTFWEQTSAVTANTGWIQLI